MSYLAPEELLAKIPPTSSTEFPKSSPVDGRLISPIRERFAYYDKNEGHRVQGAEQKQLQHALVEQRSNAPEHCPLC